MPLALGKMWTTVVFALLMLLGLIQAQKLSSYGGAVPCRGACLGYGGMHPALKYRHSKCSEPRVESFSGSESTEYTENLSRYYECACDIAGLHEVQACCMVDYCGREDAMFSFDCGKSDTWVSCGRGPDTRIRLYMTSGMTGTTASATESGESGATDTGVPSSGQSSTAPNETGNADESDNDNSNNDGSNSNAMAIGLSVGLGVGLPLILIGAGVLGFCVWRKKRQQSGKEYAQPPLPGQHTPDRWTSPSTFVSVTDTGFKHTSELNGGQIAQRYELSPDSNRTSEMP